MLCLCKVDAPRTCLVSSSRLCVASMTVATCRRRSDRQGQVGWGFRRIRTFVCGFLQYLWEATLVLEAAGPGSNPGSSSIRTTNSPPTSLVSMCRVLVQEASAGTVHYCHLMTRGCNKHTHRLWFDMYTLTCSPSVWSWQLNDLWACFLPYSQHPLCWVW